MWITEKTDDLFWLSRISVALLNYKKTESQFNDNKCLNVLLCLMKYKEKKITI